MIDLENVKLITLSDGSKWIAVSETVYNNEKYKYLLGVNENEDDITEETKFAREYDVDGQTFIEEVEDENIIKIITPLLIPEEEE